MDHLVTLSNELRLGQITTQEFRTCLMQSIYRMSANELLQFAYEFNTIDDGDDWDDVELTNKQI